jgi:catechol 2,3-dioxygenase-like lactoylglutathione lyase family enzyme
MAPDIEYLPQTFMLGRRLQIGMVVHDMDSALQMWTSSLRVGPWIVVEDALMDRTYVHRGVPSKAQFSVAFSYSGDTQLELIMPTDGLPSAYREFLDAGREGVHHLGFWPDDYRASCRALEEAGFRELSRIDAADGTPNVSYYESPAQLGVVVEVVPMNDLRQATFEAVERLTAAWDGSDPIRRFRTRQEFVSSQR